MKKKAPAKYAWQSRFSSQQQLTAAPSRRRCHNRSRRARRWIMEFQRLRLVPREKGTMRLIYERGQRIGPDPADFYVYLWTHDGVARYIGKGVNGRWADHLTPKRGDFPLKYRYFLKYLSEMACSIMADRLSEDEAAQLEIERINHHGFLADGSGTLLNARGGFHGPRRTRAPREVLPEQGVVYPFV
jgi:hypothetical protein